MSVLLSDVDNAVARHFGWSRDAANELIKDILCADDTLLVESDAEVLQTFTNCIVESGREYGLELHWGKTLLLRIRHKGEIIGQN